MIAESLPLAPVVAAAPQKVSSLRKWGPAMIAVAMVLAVNGWSFRNGAPVMSEHAQRKLAAAQARTQLVQSMEEVDVNYPKFGTYNHDMGRKLAVDHDSMMEYTRRRHRYLSNYVHEDVSGRFSLFGKISTSLIYFAYWVFLMFPNWFLPIGRPGIALGGGLTMVVWRFLLRETGHGPLFKAEHVIIMEPLFLLFGLMLTTIYIEKMERGGLFDKLRESLDDPVSWKRSAKIMAMSTIGSAAVMNDSVVLIFSAVVVDLCVRHKVANSMPYLLSLATTANIGSALTMTGNPQNILIVSLAYDDIGWIEFAQNMLLPVIAATMINAVMVIAYYAGELFPGSSGIGENMGIVFAGNRTPEMLAQEHAYYARRQGKVEDDASSSWSMWSRLQLVVVILFLICFASGLDVCVVSICAGAILMVISSYKRQHYDPRPSQAVQYDADGNPLPPKKLYDMDGNEIQPEDEELVTESETTLTEVDYGLLMLFIGQFLLIGSFDDTGVPQGFFNVTMMGCKDSMTDGACVYWFVFIITILSNIASNVPVCQMLAATFPYATPYDWLQVSFSATIAGNLTMLGSAANMIVAFQAAKVGDRSFTSERHAPFGIPSTLACLYAGTFLLASVHFSPDCSKKLYMCEGQVAPADYVAPEGYNPANQEAAANNNAYNNADEGN
jgi:Na+/H+ antiporter NhaD/arsenite permease-like protein